MPASAAHILALVYAVYALPFVLLLAVLVPPMQAPDEVAHFGRADQISHGELFAYRFAPGAAGGRLDIGLVEALQRFAPLALHTESKVTRALYAPIGWGPVETRSFPNTALYPPVFYVPSIIAIWCGKAIGFDVVRTATLARLSTGLVSVGIGVLAIASAGAAATWLFTLLLMPSSALLMGAISQDGPMLACAALAVSLMIDLQRESTSHWRGKLLLLCAVIACMGMARPPYSIFAILPLALTRLPVRARLLSASATFVVTAGWSVSCAMWTLVSVDPFHKADPAGQLHYLAMNVAAVPALISNTFSKYFFMEYAGYFVAPLQLPGGYFALVWLALAVALAGSIEAGARPFVLTVLTVGSAALTAVLGIFAIQYLTWTAVGGGTIDGVLGRYFLPVAVLLGCCLTRADEASGKSSYWLYPIIVALPVLSIILSVRSIILRFYI